MDIRQFSTKSGVIFWKGEEFYIMATSEGSYMHVMVLRPCGVCTISWYSSHIGLHMKSINKGYIKHLIL